MYCSECFRLQVGKHTDSNGLNNKASYYIRKKQEFQIKADFGRAPTVV